MPIDVPDEAPLDLPFIFIESNPESEFLDFMGIFVLMHSNFYIEHTKFLKGQENAHCCRSLIFPFKIPICKQPTTSPKYFKHLVLNPNSPS
jgi:hypothetical protein